MQNILQNAKLSYLCLLKQRTICNFIRKIISKRGMHHMPTYKGAEQLAKDLLLEWRSVGKLEGDISNNTFQNSNFITDNPKYNRFNLKT